MKSLLTLLIIIHLERGKFILLWSTMPIVHNYSLISPFSLSLPHFKHLAAHRFAVVMYFTCVFYLPFHLVASQRILCCQLKWILEPSLCQFWPNKNLGFFLFLFLHLYWSIIALQWCVICCCITN